MMFNNLKQEIIFYLCPCEHYFQKPFHWILNTGNHGKSMRRAVGV